LQSVFGGRIRLCCSGGAALPDHVASFYNDRGVMLIQGYGLTETSPVITINTDPARIGSVGRPIPGVEVRVANDGEIITRGPHVMRGYRNLAKATADTMRDGWLLTGDLGRIDDDGYVYITGRKKELIVTAGGKNIAPVILEALLTCESLIQQAMIIGDGRNYLTALIVVEPKLLAEELKREGVEIAAKDWTTDARVLELYAQRIARQLSGVSQYEQVIKFTLLSEPFSVELGELTASLKMRRGVIAQHYSKEIEAMYGPPPAEKGMQEPA
jgi:long-chain acyl-CoA synthetase